MEASRSIVVDCNGSTIVVDPGEMGCKAIANCVIVSTPNSIEFRMANSRLCVLKSEAVKS